MSSASESPRDAARRLSAGAIRGGFKPQALHTYTDETGAALYWRIRAKHPESGEKWIRPMKLNGAGFVIGEPAFEGGKPLYRLHELAARPDAEVIVTEGEQKADRLAKLGLTVMTSGSASSADAADWKPLAGRRVIVWPDNDQAGQEYADAVTAALMPLGCTVQRIDVQALGLGPKEDAADWLDRNPGATAADVLALPVVQAAPGIEVQNNTEGPMPLPAELLPVDPFPLEALPDTFAPWVQDVTDRMRCPPDYVAVPMLVAAASLVARHVGIRPQARSDWTERGNLWAMLVGRPGQMKSPAMAQALGPIERLEALAASAFNDEVANFEGAALVAKVRADAAMSAAKAALKKDSAADVSALLAAPDELAEPVRKRFVVNDATYEKLGAILSENPGGVLSVRDELRGLFKALEDDQNAAARAFFLQAWSGGSYTFDRIGRGTVTVADARLSMLGNIQPGPLCELVRMARRGAADDGLLQRFLVVWPDPPTEWVEVDRWPDTPSKRTAWKAFERLDLLTPEALQAEQETDAEGQPKGLPFLRFADDAREAFSEWHADLQRTLRATDAEGLEAALSKFRHHVPALALALHVIDGGTGPVNLKATLRALTLADYFESHARRLHGSGRRIVVQAARLILAKAKAGELPDPFTARDVYRREWTGLADAKATAEPLDMLAAYGWLAEATLDTGGRPTTVYRLTEGARRG